MDSWRRTEGQAAAELVALLPLAALLLAGAGSSCSPAMPRGRPARPRGRPRVRPRSARRARGGARRAVRAGSSAGCGCATAGRGTVEVTLRIPPVLGLPVLGHTTATAHFRPQR